MAKPYVTRAGYDLLQGELNFLWEVRRPEVTQQVAWAASLGDRSENADYQYNKRLLAQLDRRIRYLRRMLGTLQVVEYNPQQQGRVFFGAYVELEDEDSGEVLQLRIVGGSEIFGRDNYISVDAPLARALLGKAEGDEARVQTPRGARVWAVNRIAYRRPQWFEELEPHTMEHPQDDGTPAPEGGELDEEEARNIEQEYLATLAR